MTITDEPCADAARHEDEQDALEAYRERALIESPLIVLNALQETSGTSGWFKNCICTGKNWTPDEILNAARECDDGTESAFIELMTDLVITNQQRDRMFLAAASWFGTKYALDIYHCEVVKASDSL